MKTAFTKNGFRFTFHFSDSGKDNFITRVCSSVKDFYGMEKAFQIRVIDNPCYAYKINKKSVSAAGGAYGLFKLVKDCIDNDFAMIWVYSIIKSVTEMGAL